MDEKYQGVDVEQISNVEAGSHYIKVLKDSIQIFGELVQVTEGTAAIVLVKNTPEVQKKLLESKYPQQLEYKAKRIEVLISTRYVTQTTGGSTSVTYPGYYIYNTKTQVNTTTNTEAVTDWKLVIGGTREVSEMSLAQMAKLTALQDRIQTKQDQLSAYNAERARKNKKLENIGGFTCIGGSALTGAIFYGIFKKTKPEWYTNLDHKSSGMIPTLGAVGIMSTIVGYGLLVGSGNNKGYYLSHYITLAEAADAAIIYNQNLKKLLGLPESYEP